MKKLENKWVIIEKVLLHVGLWTFANVEIEDISKHHMHSEYIEIDTETASRLNRYKKEWKRIIAVGTTSVRTLESMSDQNWHLWHGSMDTQIFIYPGYDWKFVDSIITNFHLPKSTLLMLVSSFSSQEIIKKAYEHAVDSEYRFFSFWDAMWMN
jgi:S-adenosylmethionine:tRNA ribosyltransferase-isomerase